jgi:hypothetical protein
VRLEQLFFALVVTGMVAGVVVLCWAALGGFLQQLLTDAGDLVALSRTRRGDPKLALAQPLKRKMLSTPAIAIGIMISFFSR